MADAGQPLHVLKVDGGGTGNAFLMQFQADILGIPVEVAAVHNSANASLIAGYGYAGILVAFIARQHPLAVIPVAILTMKAQQTSIGAIPISDRISNAGAVTPI